MYEVVKEPLAVDVCYGKVRICRVFGNDSLKVAECIANSLNSTHGDYNIRDVELVEKDVEDILKKTEISVHEITRTTRKRHLVDLRRLVYIELINRNHTITGIAKFFGQNHTTILHHREKHSELIQFDKQYKKLSDDFNNKLKSPAQLLQENLQPEDTSTE